MRRTWLPLVALMLLGLTIPAYAAPQAAPSGLAEAVLPLPDASAGGAPDAVAKVTSHAYHAPGASLPVPVVLVTTSARKI